MKYVPPAVVILLSVITLFWRLDGTLLWRDEASTACWGREMVERRSLVPRVFDGERLIVQAADGHDFNDRFLPVMQGWLQFYVAALGILIGGAGTVAARLPFVLAGAMSLGVLYRVGRELFSGSLAPLAAPLLGALSIYFLTAARQARYYILVVLFTSCILLEFARYLKEPGRARSWGFYLRLGLYGVLVFHANYVSFGGLWLSLTVFALATRDRALIYRFLALSAAMAAPIGAQFLLVHSEFVAGSAAARAAPWQDYLQVFSWHGVEMFRLIPLAGVIPAAWYVFLRRRQPRNPISAMALLAALIVVVSATSTILAAKTGAVPRYYFQVVPAVLLLTAILTERLAALAGRAWAAPFFLFALLWPNLNLYLDWSLHVVQRQLTRDVTANEPLVDFLRRNVKQDETVAFYRNVQGMMVYFNLPSLRWRALLDSDAPRNQRLRGTLPDSMFDDYAGVDWYVVWDNYDKMPRKLTADHQLVWQYTYTNPKSWWDRRWPDWKQSYRVYRRPSVSGARK